MTSIGVYTNTDKCDDRRDHDWYPTPWEATEGFMLVEEPWLREYDRVDEPACGDGSMADVVRGHGKDVYASDLMYRGYGVGEKDFLKPNDKPKSRALITNPPFDVSESFIRIAHHKGYEYIAMLLKANYWHAQCRIPLFRDHPPVRIYPIGWRVDFTGGGSNHFDCIWCVWMPGVDQATEYCQPIERPAFLSQPSLV